MIVRHQVLDILRKNRGLGYAFFSAVQKKEKRKNSLQLLLLFFVVVVAAVVVGVFRLSCVVVIVSVIG